MKIRQRDLDNLAIQFKKWRGSDASINSYRDDHDRLVIALERPENRHEFVGICFTYCVFISGPTRWKSCDLKCKTIDIADGDAGFEIWDEASGFVLRCVGAIVVGDGEVIVPSD